MNETFGLLCELPSENFQRLVNYVALLSGCIFDARKSCGPLYISALSGGQLTLSEVQK